MRYELHASTVFAALAALAVTHAASAETLSERRASRDKLKEVSLEVACGRADKENCAVVVPEVNVRTVANQVRLTPLESKGSVESIKGLCDGDVNVAVVQADAYAALSRSTSCSGKLAVLGPPVYPYLGFMVVSNERKSKDSFQGMVENPAEGKVLRIAAGGPGSGGELTLRTVLNQHPDWKSRVSIEPDGADTALNKVADGQLDAFFVMDAPKSPLIDLVRQTTNPKTHKPTFKFVDFRPSGATKEMTFNNGWPVYATMTVAPGVFSSTKTIATPAITAVRNDWYQENPHVASVIRQGLEDASATIAAGTGAPTEWKNSFTR
ncbi:MAG: hypothetical protein JO110_21455 [Acetobacteraceae bacterium]|nr:hypothetical protein [Acetobacteraceae bacterium]